MGQKARGFICCLLLLKFCDATLLKNIRESLSGDLWTAYRVKGHVECPMYDDANFQFHSLFSDRLVTLRVSLTLSVNVTHSVTDCLCVCECDSD